MKFSYYSAIIIAIFGILGEESFYLSLKFFQQGLDFVFVAVHKIGSFIDLHINSPTQVYPQFPYLLAVIRKAAWSKSASLSTTVGLFPPNSKMQGIKFSAAALSINCPFSGEPVKIIKSHLCEQIFFAISIYPSITW